MSWIEFVESQNVSKDAENRRVGMRLYKVWDYARTAILGDPSTIQNGTGIGLPGYNSQWEGMALDRYDVNAVGSIYELTALYSNDRRFHGPGQPPTLDKSSWTGSIQTMLVPIPFAKFISKEIIVNVTGGSPPTLIQNRSGWQFEELNAKHKFERMGSRVYVNDAEIVNALSAIYAQDDKLHRILGRWYHFEGAEYASESDGRWLINYSWTHDPGTRTIQRNNGITGPPPPPYSPPLLPPQDKAWPPGGIPPMLWVRPPFHDLIVSSGGPDPADIPVFEALLNYDTTDPLGWVTLPKFNP